MIDLHTHSTASDGSFSPAELVALAGNAGLTHLALTDHNTTKGLTEFLRAARGSSVHAIAGCEITCEIDGKELHILALNLREEYFPQLEEILKDALCRSECSKREMVDKLRRAGYPIDSYDEIQKKHPGSVINRAHVGMALQEAGCVPTVKAAFDTLLGEGLGYYRPAERLQAVDVVHFIRDLQAIPVWAHPFLELNAEQVENILTVLVPAGFVAMEAYYSTYTEEETQAALALARQFGLRISGGSDFHGQPKPDIALGVGRGNLNIPTRVVEDLLLPV